MNKLEQRLTRDLRAQAEHITPPAIPPLRLPGPDEHRARRPGRRMAWITPVAAASAVITIFAAVHVMQPPAPAHHPHRPQIQGPHVQAPASHRPWWQPKRGQVTFCVPPVVARVQGNVLQLGNCEGLLGIPAQQITLRVGQQIDIHLVQEGARYPLPRTSQRRVLVRTWTSADRATATYRAIHPGNAILASRSVNYECLGNGRDRYRSCPVLNVTVIP